MAHGKPLAPNTMQVTFFVNYNSQVISSVKPYDRGLNAPVKTEWKPVLVHGNGPNLGPANGKDHSFSKASITSVF